MKLRSSLELLARIAVPLALASRFAFAQDAAPKTDPAKAESPKVDSKGPASKTDPAQLDGAKSDVAKRDVSTLLPTIDSEKDLRDLREQGKEKAAEGKGSSEVFSDDWWTRSRPLLELHGYFRTRSEILQNFSLGRFHGAAGDDSQYLWPQPLDNSYTPLGGTAPGEVKVCGTAGNEVCSNKTQATANMRFRMSPELHISDNLRILSMIDALDNLVLGSTPDSYALGNNGTSAGVNGYAPIGGLSTTQGPPTAGVNGVRNSIDVKRVWAEYATPLGQIRFGRMPFHWGMGMLYNAGNGFDQEYESTIDRIMFTSGLKSADLYFGGTWDFLATGPTNGSVWDVYGGQSNSTANLANVAQWSAFVFRRQNPELERLSLSKGNVVVNGGAFFSLRRQEIDIPSGSSPLDFKATDTNKGLERRGLYLYIPDVWVQVLWKKMRFEAEAAAFLGEVANPNSTALAGTSVGVRQLGVATEFEFREIEDKLRAKFGFGWASGDPWQDSLAPGNNRLTPGDNGRAPLSTFRFNPSYQVDQIFFRRLLTRVQGAYYFRAAVDYDFQRNTNGQRFGAGVYGVYSRASEFTQTPGHDSNLGVELGASVYFQAKDGILNDDPNKMGGFYSALQFASFFPMAGLDYLPGEKVNRPSITNWDLSSAQIVRLLLGVTY